MATLQELHLALQTIQNFEGLRKNMVDNALDYKARLGDGRLDAAKCEGVMREDADQYLRVRLGWHEALVKDPAGATALDNGLASLGASKGELDASYAEMKKAAEDLSAVSVKSLADGVAAADALLGSVTPTFGAMWNK